MPELPDIEIYVEAINQRAAGLSLEHSWLTNPFVSRTVDPPMEQLHGKRLLRARRMGKRVVLEFAGDLYVAIHLMVLGRLHWKRADFTPSRRTALAAWKFTGGILALSESGAKRMAMIHVVRGRDALALLDRGGIDPLEAELPDFTRAMTLENRTLKRALTDPRTISGIGNAYSDEILHAARLSPLALTQKLTGDEFDRLLTAMKFTLRMWMERLRSELKGKFPECVTAFHSGMSVHGRFGLPCPTCGAPVQRIVYAENETNYCARCQTGGRVLADRSLSRLLKDDWPRSIEELE